MLFPINVVSPDTKPNLTPNLSKTLHRPVDICFYQMWIKNIY